MHLHRLGARPHDALGRRDLAGDIRLRKTNAVEHDPPHKNILPQVAKKGKWVLQPPGVGWQVDPLA